MRNKKIKKEGTGSTDNKKKKEHSDNKKEGDRRQK